MAIQRKCPNCLTWNDEESHCKSCATALAPELIREKKDKIKEAIITERPPNALDRIVDGMRYSRWLPIRAIFWMAYSVWLVLFAIVSFFIALIAWTPG